MQTRSLFTSINSVEFHVQPANDLQTDLTPGFAQVFMAAVVEQVAAVVANRHYEDVAKLLDNVELEVGSSRPGP